MEEIDVSGALPAKRAHEDIVEVEQDSKRQKTTDKKKKDKHSLSHLRQQLEWAKVNSELSSDVKTHCEELERLLFPSNEIQFKGSAEPPSANPHAGDTSAKSQAQVEPQNNPHTAVPPPFALPSKDNFTRGPSAALDALNKVAPPVSKLPPVPTYNAPASIRALSNAPSTELPPLPPITDIALANAPFTHTSTLPAYVSPNGTNSYEPLEFLGDAYLELISTRLIHTRFPDHVVGRKANLRELLVKNETLAEYSRAYGFGERLHTAVRDASVNTPGWTKMLADVFEAYLACIVIQDPTDAGFRVAEEWLTELWAPKILHWQASDGKVEDKKQLDAKADLNRLLNGKDVKIEYREEKPMQLVKDGNRTTYYIGIYLSGWGFVNQRLGSGEGRSKQIAGTIAANEALAKSQDIIQAAYQRKLAYEKHSKKQNHIQRNAQNKRDHGQGQGRGRGGHHGQHGQQGYHQHPGHFRGGPPQAPQIPQVVPHGLPPMPNMPHLPYVPR